MTLLPAESLKYHVQKLQEKEEEKERIPEVERWSFCPQTSLTSESLKYHVKKMQQRRQEKKEKT